MTDFHAMHRPLVKSEMHNNKRLTDVTETLADFTRRSRSFSFEEKPSDSPFVQTIWRTLATIPATCNENPGPFIFPAVRHWGLIVTKNNGKATLTIWGPGTKATPALCPRNGESEIFGIMFKQGVFMPHLPLSIVRDRKDVTLPVATSKSFWLNGSAWQFPDYENADTFVDRLGRYGLLVRDEMVETMLKGQLNDVSLRSAQRRFLQATGLTHSTVRQMERANFAKELLCQGISILDTVFQAGYYDQAHLSRSLKHFIGLTPAQIVRLNQLI